MTVQIPLTRGLVALVDDEDAEWLEQWRWYALKINGGRFYAVRGTYCGRENGKNKTKTLYMHREILRPPPGWFCDHIDNDGLNNRRSNLRPANRFQNCQNARTRVGNSSGFKGVNKERNGRFEASIQANGIKRYLGTFATAEEAHEAYCKAATELHGDFARLT